MNHMVKYIAPLAALGLLLLTTCSNILVSAAPEAVANNGLHIAITSAETEERTLYPTAPIFSKYQLEFFSGNSASGIPSRTETLNKDNPAITLSDLDNGTWTIKAIGIITINGSDYEAADGTETITVNSGGFQSLNIVISSKQQSGVYGTFSYNIAFPASVNYARLYIHDIGQQYNYGYYYSLNNNQAGSTILAAGYYMMSVRLQTSYRTITWTEVVHIYSNLETKAERVFTEDDLNKFVNIGGSVNITANGVPVNNFSIEAEFEVSGGWEWAGYASINGNQWNLSFLPSNTDRNLYLYVEFSVSGTWFSRTIGPITVRSTDTNISYPINIAINTVTISGTVNITLDGAPVTNPDYALDIYDSAGNYITYTDSRSNSWSLELPASYINTSLDFHVSYYGENDRSTGVNQSVTVTNANMNNITLSLDLVSISGTVNVTLNETPVTAFSGELSVADSAGNYIASSSIDNNLWSAVLSASYINTPLNFQVYTYMLGGDMTDRLIYQSVTIYDANKTNVDLSFHLKTINGTVSNIPAAASVIGVFALSDSLFSLTDNAEFFSKTLGSTWFWDTNSWSVYVPSTAVNSLWFLVTTYDYSTDTQRYYITPNAVNTSGTVGLNINQMNELTYSTSTGRAINNSAASGGAANNLPNIFSQQHNARNNRQQ